MSLFQVCNFIKKRLRDGCFLVNIRKFFFFFLKKKFEILEVERLYISTPVRKTIDYILRRIYVCKEIKPFWKKTMFKNLLLKLPKECVFSVNNNLIKQINGRPTGCPISVFFSDIYISNMEEGIVALMKPSFHKRYVDGTYLRKKKNELESLFEKLNSYHPNIKVTIKKNPKKFLDSEIIKCGCEIEASLR